MYVIILRKTPTFDEDSYINFFFQSDEDAYLSLEEAAIILYPVSMRFDSSGFGIIYDHEELPPPI